MINNYVNKLIDNLPNTFVKNPLEIDLILDGGLFNGSYLVGALYFLKEMEKKKYIKINRISSCSIGSIIAFFYFIDYLDIVPKLYNLVLTNLKQKYNLNLITNLKQILQDNVPIHILNKMNFYLNNKMYISYYNIKKGRKIIKYNYKNVDDIINTIIKSCFIPFLINGNMLYKKQYVDGINPYIFNKNTNKKILYLDLFGYDKISYFINVKNEKTNYHRILYGLLDIHTFFIKEKNTSMCSYVDDWNILNKSRIFFKNSIEKICIYIIYFIFFINNYIDRKIFKFIKNDFITSKIIYFIKTFCI